MRLDRQLLLIGGGHGHVQVLRDLAMDPIPGLQVTLISSESFAPYSGMLPGYLAGWYKFEDIHFDLRALCEQGGITFLHDRVVGVDAQSQEVQLARGPSLSYDLASINVGIQPEIPPHFAGDPRLIPLKPISKLVGHWEKTLGSCTPRTRIAVVGGGASGCEMALILRMRTGAQVVLYHRGHQLLPGHSLRAAHRMLGALHAQGVDVRLGEEPETLDGIDRVWLATHAKAPGFLEGLPLDGQGFLQVDEELRATPTLFGVGDCVQVAHHRIPKSGVYAVFGGRVLKHNLRAALLGRSLKRYLPQKKTMALITTGPKRAMVSFAGGGYRGEGVWAWKLKDHIDKKFMKRFSPKPMDMDPSTMMCGACGSKVGGQTLEGLGLGPFRDAGEVSLGEEKLLQSLDYFEDLSSDPTLMARVLVEHALNDLYAPGSKPLSAMSLLRIPRSSSEVAANTLKLAVRGLKEGLGEIPLVGGHTLQGDKLGIGLAVTGGAGVRTKQGLKTGEVLVCTKPLGTGVLLAGFKRGLLNGRGLERAFESMLLSHRYLSDKLFKWGVTSCTDVSGFGLLGHLKEMQGQHSLKLHAPSLLPGVRELILKGVESTLLPDNLAYVQAQLEGVPHPTLLDPQTSGGLVFGVKAPQTQKVLTELRELGFSGAWVCGEVLEVSDHPRLQITNHSWRDQPQPPRHQRPESPLSLHSPHPWQ